MRWYRDISQQVLYEEADILDVRIIMSIFLPANAEAI